jgi:hypothetical protein
MMAFIVAGFVFGSAGLPPVGSRGVGTHKITGKTPALPKTLPNPSFYFVSHEEKKLARNASKTAFSLLELPSKPSGNNCSQLNSWEPQTDVGYIRTKKENSMANDSHQRAAEFHELAAHAHRTAAAHHGKEDHQTGQEHSRQALEHATKAFELSQEAHRNSLKLAEKP